MNEYHIPVLAEESIELLDIRYQNPETDMEALLTSSEFALVSSGGSSGEADKPGDRNFAEFKI